MSLAQTILVMPDEIKVAIAAGVLYLVRLVLAGRVPDAFVSELAVIVTTGILGIIQLALGLVPAEFEAVAASILQLIAVLLSTVLFANGYRLARANLHARGLRA